MAEIEIALQWFFIVPLALFGALWMYRDAKSRKMDTADMWAVGFFVAFFLLPFLGGILVFAFYLRKRNRGGGFAYSVPSE